MLDENPRPEKADSASVFRQAAVAVAKPLALSSSLLRWFDSERRSLPWRAERGAQADPYAVWVSEVMLQQTRVDVVRDYFLRWMERLPTLQALADASEDEVLHLWQGLGYYSRARRLRAGARFVCDRHAGRLPQSPDELIRVPGIGPYSAGAIASIAYGRPAPVVDGNVVRVLSRLFGLAGDPARNPLKAELWRLAQELVPKDRPGDFNQALMELGALVCTPKKPLCSSCPLNRTCVAFAEGRVEELPQLKKKQPPTKLHMIVLVGQRGGRYLVRQQELTARWWAGLWTFPFFEAPLQADPLAEVRALGGGISRGAVVRLLPSFSHTITRFRIQLSPVLVRLPSGTTLPVSGDGKFLPLARLGELAMPAPHRRVQGSF